MIKDIYFHLLDPSPSINRPNTYVISGPNEAKKSEYILSCVVDNKCAELSDLLRYNEPIET